jgi:hypothetical protein
MICIRTIGMEEKFTPENMRIYSRRGAKKSAHNQTFALQDLAPC